MQDLKKEEKLIDIIKNHKNYVNSSNNNMKSAIKYLSLELRNTRERALAKIFSILKIAHYNYNGEFKSLFFDSEFRIKFNKLIEHGIISEKTVFEKNAKRFTQDGDDIFLDTHISHKLIEYIVKYLEEESLRQANINVNHKEGVSDYDEKGEYKYYLDYHGVANLEEYRKKIDELGLDEKFKYVDEEEDDEILIPSNEFDYRRFIMNAKDNIFIKYFYNHLEEKTTNPTKQTLQTQKIRINNYFGEDALDVEYAIACQDCGKRIFFDRFYSKHSLKCDVCESTLSRTSSNITVDKKMKLYKYSVSIYNEKEHRWVDDEKLWWSIEKLFTGEQEVQFVKINHKERDSHSSTDYNLIVAYNKFFRSEKIGYDIITKEVPKGKVVSEHIYDCLCEYFHKEHDLTISNQNRMVNVLGVFSSLCNLCFSMKMSVVMLGESGVGKSFLTENILPALNLFNVIVSGTNVSKSKYVGGKPEVKSSLSAVIFQKGIVGTNNLVTIEEFGSVLNLYVTDSSKYMTNNILNMEKEFNDNTVKTTTHGTTEYPLKATRIFNGNLENLESYSEYRNELFREYKKLGGIKFKSNLPIYRPVQWYIDIVGDELLARAHYNLRSGNRISKPSVKKINWDFSLNHYVLHVEDALFSRFSYVFVFEHNPYDNGSLSKEELNMRKGFNNFVDTKRIHTKQIVDEIEEIITKINLDLVSQNTSKMYADFFEEINEYIEEEFLKKRNNYIFGNKKRLNSHIKNRLLKKARAWFMLEKMFKKEKLELTEEDKELFEKFEVYNYNSLGFNESVGKTTPMFNDYYKFQDYEAKELNYQKIQQQNKLKRQQAIFRDMIVSEQSTEDYAENCFDDEVGGAS